MEKLGMNKTDARDTLRELAEWLRSDKPMTKSTHDVPLAIDFAVAALERELFRPSKAEKPETIRDLKAKKGKMK